MDGLRKLKIVVTFTAILIVVGITAALLNIRQTQEGLKAFQVEIVSEHNNYHKVTTEKSDLLFLGEYLRAMESCQGDESAFGFFITGWDGVESDESYFWWVSVNGEDSMVGVDDIPLIEGDVYTFTHTSMEGW